MTKTSYHKKLEDLTARDGIHLAENHPDLTPKEREKTLAISIIERMVEVRKEEDYQEYTNSVTELKLLWEFSQMCSKYEIPELNIDRAVEMHKNPAKFVNYKQQKRTNKTKNKL